MNLWLQDDNFVEAKRPRDAHLRETLSAPRSERENARNEYFNRGSGESGGNFQYRFDSASSWNDAEPGHGSLKLDLPS